MRLFFFPGATKEKILGGKCENHEDLEEFYEIFMSAILVVIVSGRGCR